MTEKHDLESLPPELIHIVLRQLPDFNSLSALVHASPVYHAVYLSSRERILSKITIRTLQTRTTNQLNLNRRNGGSTVCRQGNYSHPLLKTALVSCITQAQAGQCSRLSLSIGQCIALLTIERVFNHPLANPSFLDEIETGEVELDFQQGNHVNIGRLERGGPGPGLGLSRYPAMYIRSSAPQLRYDDRRVGDLFAKTWDADGPTQSTSSNTIPPLSVPVRGADGSWERWERWNRSDCKAYVQPGQLPIFGGEWLRRSGDKWVWEPPGEKWVWETPGESIEEPKKRIGGN